MEQLHKEPTQYYQDEIGFATLVKNYCERRGFILSSLPKRDKSHQQDAEQKMMAYQDDYEKVYHIFNNALKNVDADKSKALISNILRYKYEDIFPILESPSIELNVTSQIQLIGLLGRIQETLEYDAKCWKLFAELLSKCWYLFKGKEKFFNPEYIRKNR
jgi:hypothetical protein